MTNAHFWADVVGVNVQVFSQKKPLGCQVTATNVALEGVTTYLMKHTLTVRSLFLSAALFGPAFGAQPSRISDADALVSLSSIPTASRSITLKTVDFMLGVPRKKLSPDRSMSSEAVEVMLGIPGAKLSFNVWVYWNFKVEGIPGCDSCDTLVVEFTENRVSFVRIGRSEEVRAFIALQQAEALKAGIAAR